MLLKMRYNLAEPKIPPEWNTIQSEYLFTFEWFETEEHRH